MAFRLHSDGTVECDTIAEARAALQAKIFAKTAPVVAAAAAAAPKKRRRRRRGKNAGVAKQWADARALAAKEGISVGAARSKLAAKRK